jgi:hypothetical protein
VPKRVGPEPEASLMFFLQRVWHQELAHRWFFEQNILVGASMIKDDGFQLISGIEA